ncbi:hypothetical protein ASPSYDRAFT_129046 [Aspergillus sydowii CBS 593.65]|uniref:Ecp2 effector protein domain-containing protein n=1 Tax=Aspergillus sydowii CBS 593.65 TaxID=1036612 RepID=A0A1L9TRT0_9EURO|nr:uncharacterized protein ASPSYDRAFT_129046 [Aspergillus sydowii CBS 593.65]OJJ62142.1 hypothetical protein ASPSYDRAFT_129046 [Aspergillus sydowii CBS 593.65]
MFRPFYTVFVALLALMQVAMAAPTASFDITSLEIDSQDLDLSVAANSDIKEARAKARAALPSHEEVICRANDHSPHLVDVQAGMRALRAKGGQVVIKEGTSTFGLCDVPVEGRVKHSAIWVCNRTGRDSLTLSSYSVVADAAQLIVDECKKQGAYPMIEGEVRFSDGWTASVRPNLFQ